MKLKIKLVDLEPQFLRVKTPGKEYIHADALLQAQGVRFLCPVCYTKNNGPVGTHQVLCWFAGTGVPDSEFPKPGRWKVTGTGFEDLTLHPSVHLSGPGCGWHGWIKNGEVT